MSVHDHHQFMLQLAAQAGVALPPATPQEPAGPAPELVDWLTKFRNGSQPTDRDLENENADKQGHLYKLQKEDMKPEQWKALEAKAKQMGLDSVPPVYLDRNDENPNPLVQSSTTQEGNTYFVINNSAFKISEFGAHRDMPSNAKLQAAIDDNSYERVQKDTLAKLDPQFLEKYDALAKRRGIHPAPDIYLDHSDEHETPLADAHQTQEGKPYVVINESSVKNFSSKQLLAILDHELGHVKNKDVSQKNLARAHNDLSLSPQEERKADLGVADPESLREALAIQRTIDKKLYLEQHPAKTSDDYLKVLHTGDTHPADEVRDAYLRQAAKHKHIEIHDDNTILPPAATPAKQDAAPSQQR